MCNQNPLDVAIEYGEHPYFSGKHMSKHEKKCALRAKKEARAYNFFEKHVVMRSTLETIDLFFSVFVVIATIVLFVTMLFNFTIYVNHPTLVVSLVVFSALFIGLLIRMDLRLHGNEKSQAQKNRNGGFYFE